MEREIVEITKEFFAERFPEKPISWHGKIDPYFMEWVERLSSENPEVYMDSESKIAWKKVLAKRGAVIAEIEQYQLGVSGIAGITQIVKVENGYVRKYQYKNKKWAKPIVISENEVIAEIKDAISEREIHFFSTVSSTKIKTLQKGLVVGGIQLA